MIVDEPTYHCYHHTCQHHQTTNRMIKNNIFSNTVVQHLLHMKNKLMNAVLIFRHH